MMVSTEKLCLQWNDFNENIASSFRDLREDREFTDVTLASEDGQQIEAHKVVLVSSSLHGASEETQAPPPFHIHEGPKIR